ncbi:hypothetical protein SAMN05216224_10640 [Thioclava dalianensis]|nr:hypothetical protein [Thioclava dalianensis]SFN48871.1 hypothetical protein SAMN05216224_10640 [Thioclava dalianensis]
MGAQDIPLIPWLDPGFLMFMAVCAVGWGIWWVIDEIRGWLRRRRYYD